MSLTPVYVKTEWALTRTEAKRLSAVYYLLDGFLTARIIKTTRGKVRLEVILKRAFGDGSLMGQGFTPQYLERT